MNLSDTDLRNLLTRHFGVDKFEPGQKEVITSVLSGRDVLAVARRGPDQSVCYKLPALVLGGLTLVVSPARKMVGKESGDLLPETYINSSLNNENLQKRIWNMAMGRYRLIYAGPEQFRSRIFLFALTKNPVSLLAVEDAHRISRWGHDYRPDYLDIGKVAQEMDSQPTILALANACTERTRNDIYYQLQMKDARRFTFDPALPDSSIEAISALSHEEKCDVLGSMVRKSQSSGIVYASSRRQTVEICDFLRDFEPKVAVYHGGMGWEKRAEVERAFASGELRVLVTTTSISFSASLDMPRVSYVVHLEMPDRLERYYEQISVAGGDGEPARCVLIYSPSDREFYRGIIERSAIVPAELWRVSELLSRCAEDGLVVLPYGQMELEAAIDPHKLRAVLREMENAGMLSLLPDCFMQARVRILIPRDEMTAHAEGEAGKLVVRWLLEKSKSDPNGEMQLDFTSLRGELGCRHDVLEDCFLSLRHAGAISYKPSRRCMSLRLIDPDVSLMDDIFEKLKGSQYQSLRDMEEYIHTRECRQRFLLNYLGDETWDDCGKCDNCARQEAGRSERGIHGSATLPQCACAAMQLVSKAEGRLTRDELVNILAGIDQRTTRFDKWEEFGALSLFAPEDIRRMLDILIGHGFLKEEDELHPPVDLTGKGFRALNGEAEPHEAESIASLAEDIKRIAQPSAPPEEHKTIPELDRALIAILRCAEKTDGQVGRWGLVKILQGQKSKKLAKYGFDHLEEYGSLLSLPKEVLLDHIDSMIERGCLSVTSFLFPMLQLTDAGRKRLEGMERSYSGGLLIIR